jgi:DNA-binding CsgD family transcriptional regulator
MNNKQALSFALCYLLPVLCYAQVASRTDGVAVFYYDSLHEAVSAAAGEAATIERPDEITLLTDVVLDGPLIVDDGRHIRLVAGAPVTVNRSPNLIEFPVIWVRGESASLSLGKPDMGFELIIDGGCLNRPPIEAHAPLVAVSGPDAKLIMYDNVTLQNNINVWNASTTSHYRNGAGVFIFTQGYVADRQAEFVMKGGTIRGNINKTENPIPCGGGVLITGFGIFTMEGGVIMGNTAGQSGGGFYTMGSGSFKKTGGVIYGSNAPDGYRNTALFGLGTPPAYGHSVAVSAVVQLLSLYREDTVGENDNLTFTGDGQQAGTVGKGGKWDTPEKAFLRIVLAALLPFLALAVCVFLFYRKITLKKLMKIAKEAATATPETVFEGVKLTDREKEVGALLLTELSITQIAAVMKIANVTVDFHSKKLYRKMGIESRTELLLMKREK